MTRERVGSALVFALLLGVGALGWWLRVQPPMVVDASALAALPMQVGSWHAVELEMDEVVESILRADLNIQRTYTGLGGEFVWLYVGYYGTARGGRPEHTPRGCYTGAGWNIVSSRVLDVAPGSPLRVTEYVVERDGHRRLVHFWYRSHRRTGMIHFLEQNVDRLLGRLGEGRADGALVRVSTPIRDGDEVLGRARLFRFAEEFDRQLASHWPDEHPAPDSG